MVKRRRTQRYIHSMIRWKNRLFGNVTCNMWFKKEHIQKFVIYILYPFENNSLLDILSCLNLHIFLIFIFSIYDCRNDTIVVAENYINYFLYKLMHKIKYMFMSLCTCKPPTPANVPLLKSFSSIPRSTQLWGFCSRLFIHRPATLSAVCLSWLGRI